jgi:hypothetical protein
MLLSKLLAATMIAGSVTPCDAGARTRESGAPEPSQGEREVPACPAGPLLARRRDGSGLVATHS